MQIKLENHEAEEMFHTALCNGLGYMSGYGLEFKFKKEDYDSAGRNLREAQPGTAVCYEDVLMQILREGGELTMVDVECDGAYTSSVSLADVHSRVQTAPSRFLIDMAHEQDDAETADVILQTVFFKEIVFG
jgi:hypothetical protein